MESEEVSFNRNPKSEANWLSSIFFIYSLDLFRKGYKHLWTSENIYSPLASHKSSFLGRRIEREWENHVDKCRKRNKAPRLYRVLLKIFWPDIFVDMSLQMLSQLLKLPEPFLLGCFLTYFSQNSSVTKDEALWYISILICMNGVRAAAFTHYKLSCQDTALKMRTSCACLIQRKVLKMRNADLGDKATENIVNLLSNDLNRFDQSVFFVHYIWSTPLCLLSLLYLLYYDAGIPGLIAVVWYIMTMFLQSYIGNVIGSYRGKIAKKTEERLKFMNEILLGIQVIKMYAWEKIFSKYIVSARILEQKLIKKATYLKCIFPSFLMVFNIIAIFVGILAMIAIGENISAAKVYNLVVYNTFFSVIISFSYPLAMTKIVELHHVFKRLEEFMLVDEVNMENKSILRLKQSEETHIIMKNIYAQWAKTEINKKCWSSEEISLITKSNDKILKGISISLKGNEFVGVVGSVGSGKSTFLSTIVGETRISSGLMSVKGSISYASQEPWIFPATIRQNIIFGQPFDETRYNDVIRVCALETDFQNFPNADLTLVGEKGAGLSGGQKTRINLARAVYKQSDIFLLDDPFASLDANVSKHILVECFQKFLTDKCRILVTHNHKHLEYCTLVLMLDSGRIDKQGTFQSIQNNLIPDSSYHNSNMEENSGNNIAEIQSSSSIAQEDERVNPQEEVLDPLIPKSQSSKSKYFMTYLKSGGKTKYVILTLAIFMTCQFVESSVYFFMGYWVHLEELRSHVKLEMFKNFVASNKEIYVFAGLIIALGIFSFLKGIFFCQLVTRNSKVLHANMLSNIIGGKMEFFHKTKSGQILSRFSKDLNVVDELLPRVFMETIVQGLGLSAKFFIVCYMNPYMLIMVGSIIVLIPFIIKVIQSTAKNISRIEASLLAPVLTHVKTTVQGISTIRASGAESMIVREFNTHQDRHMSSWYMYCIIINAFGFTVDFITFIFISVVSVSCFLMKDAIGLNGSQIGLAITQAMGLASYLQFGILQYVITDNSLVSVERLVEYDLIPQEPNINNSITLSKGWPTQGAISFQNVAVKYDLCGPEVLKNLNFTIRPKEKIGIVGRTGAGKSTIIASLFRLISVSGKIEIDGIDTSKLPLENLRSNISIIPQDPVLFAGTLRYNLDPFEEYDDNDLYKILKEVHLGENSKNWHLHDRIENNGSNLSVGQRQLINLARAILRKNRILVLDEATSNIDIVTDNIIQATIRRLFSECTVLTIAHRLSTIMDSDRIMVIESGEIVQFDSPEILLSNNQGLFYKMVNQKFHIEN